MIEYRDIEGHPGYRVGNDGSVWTRWNKGPGAQANREWRLLHVRTDHEGYGRVTFRDRTAVKVCVLVLTAFVGPCPPGMEACHGPDGVASDALTNLRWDTHAANIADKNAHGTMAKGERHGRSKLTDQQISEVRALAGTDTQQNVANRFGVSRGYVGQLWAGTRKRGA